MELIEVDYVEVDEYDELVKVIEEAEQATRVQHITVQSAPFHQAGEPLENGNANGHAVDHLVDLPQPVNLPDLEDIGLVCNRLLSHRRTGLKVTDISSSEWCQQQVAFTLSAKLPKVGLSFLAWEFPSYATHFVLQVIHCELWRWLLRRSCKFSRQAS
jgi:hypothetical protein